MDQKQSIEQVAQVKARHENALLKLANVVGVGVGFKEKNNQLTDQVAVIVNVTQKKALVELADKDVVPSELDGVATDVQEVGKIKAQ